MKISANKIPICTTNEELIATGFIALMSDFKVLKDHPDAQVIEDVLQQLSNETDAPTLEVCLLIIQHVIPIYPSLSKHTRDLTQS